METNIIIIAAAIAVIVILGTAFFVFSGKQSSSATVTTTVGYTASQPTSTYPTTSTSQTQGYGSSSNSNGNYTAALAACAKAGVSNSNCPAYCQANPSICGPTGSQNVSQSQYSAVAYAGDGTSTNAGSLPACSSSTYLTRPPINNSQFTYIEPLGHFSGPHVLPSQGDHIYFYAQIAPNGSAVPTPVYSPGNVTLLQVAAAKSNSTTEPSSSYVLFFSNCKSVMFGFQMGAISSLIQNAISGMTPTSCQSGPVQSLCVYANLSIKLKSGDRIGMIGATRIDASLDFAAADVRTTPLKYIDSEEATGFLADSYFHTVCPLDYYPNSTKQYLYSRIDQRNTSLNGIPACGTTMQDLAGTVQGNWYRKSSLSGQIQYRGFNISASLAIAHLNIDPYFGVVSAGSSLIPSQSLGTQMLIQIQQSGQINREPSQITPDGKIYCYQGPIEFGLANLNGSVRNSGPVGHVDLRLDNSTTLEIDYASGQCATTPVLTSPAVYVR